MHYTRVRRHGDAEAVKARTRQTQCSIQDCPRSGRITRGLCPMHYTRLIRNGDPRALRPKVDDFNQRFWNKVQKESPGGCWEWIGAKQGGYGSILLAGKKLRAHVLSLEWATGSIRPRGMFACHHCDNRACVNPAHLYWGTREDNTRDAMERGRVKRGEGSPVSKLSEAAVIEIRERYAAGAYAPDLALHFMISTSALREIATGKRWRHAGGPITRRGTAGRVYRKGIR